MREPEITIKFQCTLYGARRMAIKKGRAKEARLCAGEVEDSIPLAERKKDER